jgi:hypothetical protein
LLGRCELATGELDNLCRFYAAAATRIRLATMADVLDPAGVAVCRGGFEWSITRQP